MEEEKSKNKFLQSLVNVSNEFLNVFTSFGEMVGSVLGLNVNSKKSDVGNYFKKVQDTVQGIKDGLNKIVSDMKGEGNPNAEATEIAVKTLVESKLDKIIEGAKIASEAIGIESNDFIGNVATVGANAGGAKGEVENLIKGIKDIVDVLLKGVGNADAGDDKKAEDGSTVRGATAGESGKLFGNTGIGVIANDAKKAATDVTKAIGAVTGADILKAMIQDGGDSAKLATNVPTSAVNNITKPKDAVIAGGIALRAMSKEGKFANGNNADDVSAMIKGAAVSAVTKALDTLTIAIRKTMDLGLRNVKEAMKTNISATSVASKKSGSSGQNQ
ncbi:Vlp protein, gamma subfamily (plasmid) [Borrelia crocidurae str. Achema]|uniref:Variable large protein n=1 Tax=Borrelia crocidurae (strain Achema) TaxID=1155096 RepID=I0FF16_BORCA|nr:Vlp protein, gamma subfamily [Borrelia crocidurae str. Achema]